MIRNVRIVLFLQMISICMAGVLMLSACEEGNEWPLKSKETNLLVVEGLITNEFKPQAVMLSRTVSDLNGKPVPVTDARVFIVKGDTVELTQDPSLPGTYLSIPFQGVVGREYTLGIYWSDSWFYATASMVPLSPMDTLLIVPADSAYKLNYVSSSEPSMMEVTYQIPEDAGAVKKEYFYTLNTIDVNQMFAPKRETIYFTKGTTIIRKKYSLTSEHQAFVRSFLMETDWRGGIFDVAQGNVMTNLSEGAIGYFGASTVVADTTVFN